MTETARPGVGFPSLIAIAALSWALLPFNPYSYYILLRWVCCPILTYLAWQAFLTEKWNWAWIFGLSALLFNPLFRVGLTREVWTVVNIALIIAVSAFLYGHYHARRKPDTKGTGDTKTTFHDLGL